MKHSISVFGDGTTNIKFEGLQEVGSVETLF